MEYTRRSCSGAPPSWSGRSRHQAEGGIESVVSWRRSRPRRPPSRSYLMPRVRGFRVRTGDLPYEREVLARWGSSEAGVQRPAPDPDPFPPRVDQCARGWGSTGRGLCVLRESPTPMEYTRRSCSGAPPSWSGRWAKGGIDRLRGVVGRGRPRRPPSRSYLMSRVRGFRVLCCLLTSETFECHDF